MKHTPESKQPLHLMVADSLYRRLKSFCESDGSSMTSIVQLAVVEYLEKQDAKQVQA